MFEVGNMAYLPMIRSRGDGIVYDVVTWILIILATIMLIAVQVEASNTGDVLPGIQGITAIVLMFTGILLPLSIGVPIKLDNNLTNSEVRQILQYFTIGTFIVLSANLASRVFVVSASSVGSINLAILLAVTETIFVIGLYEVLRRILYLMGFIVDLVSALMATLIWSSFHLWVYGLDVSIWFILIVSGLVMTLVYRATGNRLTVPILIHLINNAFATVRTELGMTILTGIFFMTVFMVFFWNKKVVI